MASIGGKDFIGQKVLRRSQKDGKKRREISLEIGSGDIEKRLKVDGEEVVGMTILESCVYYSHFAQQKNISKFSVLCVLISSREECSATLINTEVEGYWAPKAYSRGIKRL